MKFILKLFRNALGGLIALFDLITRGRKLKRTPQEQARIETELQTLTLYQFFACPFCIKTRRALHKMNLPIQKKSVTSGSPYREELLKGGGKVQTPCLRIETDGNVEYLYESSAIIDYLKHRFLSPQE